jgi:glutathione S-transferase
MRLYKSDISYFSGKVEAYLHVKGIEHEALDAGFFVMHRIARHTGVMKLPAIELRDGRWLHDSTWMMRWLEDQHPHPPVRLGDPAEEFIAFLIEDYGDEWLWRPAMWWRWVPPLSRRQLGQRIAREFFGPVLNGPVGTWFGVRQRREWLYRDGVSEQTDAWVRRLYLDELAVLNGVLERRPFVLGSRPTWADFGYFGSMFRHFGNDPESAEVMRRRGAAVYEWLARVWRGDAGSTDIQLDVSGLDALFERVRGDYLPYLHANARAFEEGRRVFDFDGTSAKLRGTQTTTYRVHAWNALLAEWRRLQQTERDRVEALVGKLSILTEGVRVECGLRDRPSLPIPADARHPFRFSTVLGQPRN